AESATATACGIHLIGKVSRVPRLRCVARRHLERVDIGEHELAERLVYHAMALERALALDAARDDRHGEVTLAFAGARVPGVQVAVVPHVQGFGLERRHEALADQLHTFRRHGSVFSTGLISTSAKTPSSTYGSFADHA